MVALGVECDEREAVGRAVIADVLVVVLDHERAALRLRRQQDESTDTRGLPEGAYPG